MCVLLQGGMSNELYNVLARTTDGLYEGTRVATTNMNKVMLFEYGESDDTKLSACP